MRSLLREGARRLVLPKALFGWRSSSPAGTNRIGRYACTGLLVLQTAIAIGERGGRCRSGPAGGARSGRFDRSQFCQNIRSSADGTRGQVASWSAKRPASYLSLLVTGNSFFARNNRAKRVDSGRTGDDRIVRFLCPFSGCLLRLLRLLGGTKPICPSEPARTEVSPFPVFLPLALVLTCSSAL